MKKTIVFIPTYYYLSHPLFSRIVENFSDYEKVYFNTKDLVSWKYNKEGIKKNEVLKWFDKYYEVNKELDSKNSNSNKLQIFLKHKKYISHIKNVLSEIKPAAIITTSDMSYSARICNQWANRNSVPIIIIQPSFLNFGESNYNYNLKHRIKYLLFNKILNIPLYRRQPLFGNENKNNYLFLWGDYFKKFYKNKEKYNNIFLTGNPVFDRCNEVNKENKENIYKQFGFLKDRQIITICTENIDDIYSVDVFTRLIDIYKGAIINNEELFFVIKVHPRENIEKYNKAFKDLNKNNYKIIKDVNLYDLYKITDVQVSVMSYSSFEAVVLGIPIVLVNPDNKIKFFDFFNNEVELKANTAEELNECIQYALTDEYKEIFVKKRKDYLQSRLYALDGKSGERVVKRIEEIIMKRGK